LLPEITLRAAGAVPPIVSLLPTSIPVSLPRGTVPLTSVPTKQPETVLPDPAAIPARRFAPFEKPLTTIPLSEEWGESRLRPSPLDALDPLPLISIVMTASSPWARTFGLEPGWE
jgi:hypothetical protein